MRSLNFGVLVASGKRGQFGENRTHSNAAPAGSSPIDVRSGQDLAASLRKLGFGALVLPVLPESSESDEYDADSAIGGNQQRLEQILRDAGVDACMLALHGNTGGSGRIQALLEQMGIPYVGPDALHTARAYDKVSARACLQQWNLPVPTTVELDYDAPPRAEPARLGWPAVLKPRFGSQSRDLVRLDTPEAIADVLNGETGHRDGEDPFLLERWIEGVEVQVVMLDGEVLGSMQVERSGLGEGDVSYSVFTCPPELSPSRLRGIEHLARHAATSLGLGQAPTRIDIVVSMRHNEVVLEVEPLPPLHKDGVVSLVARAAGLSHESLVARVVHRMVVETSPRVRAPAASRSFAQMAAR